MKTLDQSVFHGQETKFTWAAVDDDGTCCLFVLKPEKRGNWASDGAWLNLGNGWEPTHTALLRSVASIPPVFPTPAHGWQNMFVGLGGNWRWGSVDYRGVARVHTFSPQFSAGGRVQVPSDMKGNSATAEAFDVNPVPAGWQPLVITRDMRAAGIKCVPTDRFGTKLPVGADPVQAADVVQGVDPDVAVIDEFVAKLRSGVTDPKYNVRRFEQCHCEISSGQLEELLRRELNIAADVELNVFATMHRDVSGVAITVEWKHTP
jgi:hypothetical protein